MLRLLLNRRLLISVAVIAALLAVALWPTTVPVEIGTAARGPLAVTVDEEGMTRVRDRFVVSSPVSGRVLRIELEPGDAVTRGAIVARVRAETPPLLDARSRAEGQAAIDSARAALGRARAEEQRARATQTQLQAQLTRVRELAKGRVVSAQELEVRESEAQVAAESVNVALFAVQAATAELERASARIAPSSPDLAGRIVTVTAPVDGVVLRRMRESESMVPAGEPLLEVANPQRLEIVADLLSTDSVRVKPGARAIIEQWGGDKALAARVRRIEPGGFTKISALGVEEQRVNVILDLVESAEAAAVLGDAYRVEVRVVVWETPDALLVPTSALFRVGEAWAVFVVEGDRARRQIVQLGHQTAQSAEVVSGVSPGASLILHPVETLIDGARVKAARLD